MSHKSFIGFLTVYLCGSRKQIDSMHCKLEVKVTALAFS